MSGYVDATSISVKRSFDLLLGLALAVPAAILLVPSVAAIRMNSPGAAFFRQRRVGLHGRIFTLYKLRTMYADTGDLPSHYAAGTQITPVGRWLRKTKLDELPQILNVLRGEMSFVGPRPCLPIQNELVAAREARNIYGIRPGITGLAQIRGIDMSDAERLAATDEEYRNAATLPMDISILWRTLTGSGSGDAIPEDRSSRPSSTAEPK